MKKVFLLVALVFTLQGYSTKPMMNYPIVTSENVKRVQYLNQYFEVDTTVVTVRIQLNDQNKRAVSAIADILRVNRLGYVDLQKPDSVSYENFIDQLSELSIIESIDCSSWELIKT